MAWLHKSTISNTFNLFRRSSEKLNSQPPETLGILAFEAGRTMSRLVSLYKSISDEEVSKLKKDVIKSKGVSYLNSADEDFLLNLAYAEKQEDLDHVSDTVSRLINKCSDPEFQKYDLLYRDLKLGILDMRKLEYGSRNVEKVIQKMERYVHATSNLYTAIATLSEMEMSERKLQAWKKNNNDPEKQAQANLETFEEKLAQQRKHVRHYKETSLWSKTYDKCVEFMAQAVFVVHVRLRIVFGGQPQNSAKSSRQVHPEKDYCLLSERDKYLKTRLKHISKSGPIPRNSNKVNPDPFRSCELSPNARKDRSKSNKMVLQLASPSTVGGSGLTFRYANLIILAENYLYSATINDEARAELYAMLPEKVKATMKAKLKSKWEGVKDGNSNDHALAEGWRDALEEIMGWLGPVAYDTVNWQTERNLEKQRFDSMAGAGAGVLLLQTLHFSDLEKTEAAIVEMLVGLSCIYRFEKRRVGGGLMGDYGGSGGGCRRK